MRGLLIRVGIILILIGFGAVVLHAFTIYQFRYLMWAEGAEPYFGLGIGAVGIVLFSAPYLFPAYAHEPTHVVDPPTVPIPVPVPRPFDH
jgi:hypothetical protein